MAILVPDTTVTTDVEMTQFRVAVAIAVTFPTAATISPSDADAASAFTLPGYLARSRA